MTYSEAKQILGNRESKKIAHNTYLVRLDGERIGLKYHSTFIIEFEACGTQTLRTGGWYTYTTKDRLNRFSAATVYQHKHVWYLCTKSGECEFYDGAEVTDEGWLLDWCKNERPGWMQQTPVFKD